MDLEVLAIYLIVGGVAGWLAGLILNSGGFGIIGNIIVGIIGGVFGGWLFRQLDISIGGEWFGPIATSTCGAVVLLFLIGLVRKK